MTNSTAVNASDKSNSDKAAVAPATPADVAQSKTESHGPAQKSTAAPTETQK